MDKTKMDKPTFYVDLLMNWIELVKENNQLEQKLIAMRIRRALANQNATVSQTDNEHNANDNSEDTKSTLSR